MKPFEVERERVFSNTLLLHIATKFLLVLPIFSILDVFQQYLILVVQNYEVNVKSKG